MKKLFSFRSSTSGTETNSAIPTHSTDKRVHWEKPLETEFNDKAGDKTLNISQSPTRLLSKSQRQVADNQNSCISSGLRRSRSFSSAANVNGKIEEENISCSSNPSRPVSSSPNGGQHQQPNKSFSFQVLLSERQKKLQQYARSSAQNAQGVGRSVSSESLANSLSSNASIKIVDRYIDGEQERDGTRNIISSQRHTKNETLRERIPRRQCRGPSSAISLKEHRRSHSFREDGDARFNFSSRDWVDSRSGHESPSRIAKSVIERLSLSRPLPKPSLRDYDPEIPITIEDVYGGSLDRCPNLSEHHQANDCYGFEKRRPFPEVSREEFNCNQSEVDITDTELQRRLRQSEETIMLLSEELELDNFLQDGGFNASALIQRIRNLTEEKMNLVLEVSGLLQSQISERSSAKEALIKAKAELILQTDRLENEKNELQLVLEKELDRRSSEWSSKLERYHLEEQRLRERIRELAEQNVFLQREVSSLHEREKENKSTTIHAEQQLKDLTTKVEELSVENFNLRQNLYDLKQHCGAAEEDRDCVKRNFEEKDRECKDLHKSISRLLRTCGEQEKTIDGLRKGLVEEVGKTNSQDKLDKHVAKLQMEQIRLTGIELALRREVESYKLEVDYLRHENINLLNRLKINGNESDAFNFKLDKEMWTRIDCLQNQGLSILNESTQLCSKLLEHVKEKACELSDIKRGIEVSRNSLDEQFIIESEMKVQGLRRGTENLTKSLQTISTLLHEKSGPLSFKSLSQNKNTDESRPQNDHKTSEDIISELKAERLLTSLLREKLYSRDLEVEQLQAELATAVRGSDILKCEVQNAMDNLSCVTHKLKDLELQMLMRDDNIRQLQNDLQESMKELTRMRGILPQISQERDSMWEKVKQYSEKNMLLNSELDILKKKIEVLDEDIHVKEGQITILKDTLANKSFDLLGSTDSTREFLLE